MIPYLNLQLRKLFGILFFKYFDIYKCIINSIINKNTSCTSWSTPYYITKKSGPRSLRASGHEDHEERKERTGYIYVDCGTEYLEAYQIDIFYDSTILYVDTEAGQSGVSEGMYGFCTSVNSLTPGKLTINGINTGYGHFDPDLLSPFNGNLPSGVASGPGVILETVSEPEPGMIRISGSAPADSGDGILLCTVDLEAGITTGEGDIYCEVLHLLDENGLIIGQPAGTSSRVKIQPRVGFANAVLGDANKDGLVNIIDALVVAECYICNFCTTCDLGDFFLTDVNSDDQMDILDTLLIAHYVSGLIPGFE